MLVDSTIVVVPLTVKLPAIFTFVPLVVIAVVPSLALIIFPPNLRFPANCTSVLAFGNVIATFPAPFLIVLSPLLPNLIVLSFTKHHQ